MNHIVRPEKIPVINFAARYGIADSDGKRIFDCTNMQKPPNESRKAQRDKFNLDGKAVINCKAFVISKRPDAVLKTSELI